MLRPYISPIITLALASCIRHLDLVSLPQPDPFGIVDRLKCDLS
jgi:hypothetical protein